MSNVTLSELPDKYQASAINLMRRAFAQMAFDLNESLSVAYGNQLSSGAVWNFNSLYDNIRRVHEVSSRLIEFFELEGKLEEFTFKAGLPSPQDEKYLSSLAGL